MNIYNFTVLDRKGVKAPLASLKGKVLPEAIEACIKELL